MAELRLALSLAAGDQKLHSNTGSLRLGLGQPQVLEALVHIVGFMWNGQPLLMNATALADNGIVTVTLGQYPPQRLCNVTMYIAVLMAESGFMASWNNSIGARMVELHEAKKIFEGQCKRSVFLTSRYHLCGKTKGWKSEVVSMTLSPWQPQTQQFSFDVLRLDGDRHFREDVRGGSVHITMAEPGAPAVWAVAQQGCELNLVGGEISADQDQVDVYSVSYEGVRAFIRSPPAICTYFFSNCTSLSVLIGQDPRSYSIEGNRTRRGEADLEQTIQMEDSESQEAKMTSPQLAQLLHCAREAGREMAWVRGPFSPLSIDEDDVWILGDQQLFPGSIKIRGHTLKLEDLFKAVAPKHSEVDEKLVQDVCTFLLDPTHKKPEAETSDADIMLHAMVAAFGANSGEAVQLAGKHCFNSSDPILRESFREIAKLTWEALTSSSASARLAMLNVSLHFLDGALAQAMLVHSTTSNCVGCADLLQELIQTGQAGPPLLFSHLSFNFGVNLISLAAIKGTGPWLCTRKLVIDTDYDYNQRLRGAESLRNLLEQMKLCEESPLASLIISGLLIDAHDFSTLVPGLPKKVYFSVGTTASTQASQIYPVRSEALNLDMLEDFEVNFQDSAGLIWFCTEISRARPAMLKNVSFHMVTYHHYIKVLQPVMKAMKAMAEMVVALPNLERFECTGGDISKEGLQEFSRVLALKASTLKLKSIDLSRANLEGATEDLGKALAMLPTLVEVRLGDNSMPDVTYAGFLRPFVSREGSSLKKIYVRGSGFGDAAAEVLAELMQKQGLESIDVGFTDVTDEGLSAMGRALKVGKCSFKEVNAAKIGTDTGVTALLIGLAQCPDLERATFYHTPLKEQTIDMAMKNVKNRDVWPKLEQLKVRYGDKDYDLKSEDPLTPASLE